MYEISLDESSDENSMFIELKGPKEYSVGVEFRQASSKRTKFYETKDSGSFKWVVNFSLKIILKKDVIFLNNKKLEFLEKMLFKIFQIYRPGYNVLVMESIPAGVYHLRVMTFLVGFQILNFRK